MTAREKLAEALPRKTVRVNGRVIAHAEISREVQHHPAATAGQAWNAATRALVVRELLRQEVERRGVRAPAPIAANDALRSTDEDAAIDALLAAEVAVVEPEEDSLRRYFAGNRHRFRAPALHAVSHILIAAPRGDAGARADARDRASALACRLATHPAEFADLANAHSDCPSGKVGGSLGQLSGGETVPEFEAALAQLPIGAVAAHLVETRYGFHVVRVDQRVEGREVTFEVARERVRNVVRERMRRRALANYVGRLAYKADVEGVDMSSLG